jgi:hypothetical protein
MERIAQVLAYLEKLQLCSHNGQSGVSWRSGTVLYRCKSTCMPSWGIQQQLCDGLRSELRIVRSATCQQTDIDSHNCRHDKQPGPRIADRGKQPIKLLGFKDEIKALSVIQSKQPIEMGWRVNTFLSLGTDNPFAKQRCGALSLLEERRRGGEPLVPASVDAFTAQTTENNLYPTAWISPVKRASR